MTIYKALPNGKKRPLTAAEKAELEAAQAESLSQVAADRVRQVHSEMARRMRALAEDYIDEERETWPTQVLEARDVIEGGQDAPLLSQLALARGRTLKEQAERVLFLSQAFAVASGRIMAARDAILAMAEIPEDFRHDRFWAE